MGKLAERVQRQAVAGFAFLSATEKNYLKDWRCEDFIRLQMVLDCGSFQAVCSGAMDRFKRVFQFYFTAYGVLPPILAGQEWHLVFTVNFAIKLW